MNKLTREGRRALAIVATAVTFVLLVAGVTAVGNTWRFTEQDVTITASSGARLAGVVTMPKGRHAVGVVVMVHGDGAVDATQGGLYAPWFEAAADEGWVTLSWSKPGVGGSTGSWLNQSMHDRAAEVGEAIDWAKRQADLPTGRIVLWGASQAGWVVPEVVAQRDDIDAVIAVGTAINWLRQGEYDTRARLTHEGASDQQRRHTVEDDQRTNRLLQAGASYAEYRHQTHDTDPMTRDRWEFVGRNFRADASEALREASARRIPWHLMAGEHDRHVDVHETERTYQQIFGRHASSTWFDAAHSMARPIVEDNKAAGLVTGILWPRALLAPHVVDDYRNQLRAAEVGLHAPD